MQGKVWFASTIMILVVIFGYLFSQLFTASHKVQKSISQINQVETSAKKARHIVFITQELDNPYWRTVEKGARAAAKKAGCDLEYVGPIRINPKEQMEFIDKAIASKVDGILLQGSNDPEFLSILAKADQHGIPVITVDTDSSAVQRKAYVGTDNYQSGQTLGELIVQAINGQGNIGIIVGSETALNHQLRLQGMLSVIKSYPHIKINEIETSNISQFRAAQQAEKMLKTYPTINVMVGTSALDGVGIVQAAKGLRMNHVKIFGFDDLPETRNAIANGEMEAVIVQQPYKMGYEAIQLLQQFFQGKSIPAEAFTKITVMNKASLKAGEKR